jgi:hypothetical protein
MYFLLSGPCDEDWGAEGKMHSGSTVGVKGAFAMLTPTSPKVCSLFSPPLYTAAHDENTKVKIW